VTAPGKTTRGRAGLLTTLQHRLRERIFAAGFYHHTLRAKPRENLVAQPADPWRGDAARANALFQGRFRFAGSEVQLFNRPPWTAEAPSLEWQLEAAAFAWLRDFRAEGGEAARGAARELIATWIETFGEWHPTIWRADVLGRRLMGWASHADYLLAGAEAVFRRGFLVSLERQARHLLRAVSLAPEGGGRIAALCGVMLTDAALGGLGRRARSATADLEEELREQILPDGCHVSRSPSTQLAVLRDLVWLRHGLSAARAPSPLALHGAIERMAAILALLRHGDGGLALFHGSVEEDRAIVAETLALATPAARAERTALRAAVPSPDEAAYAGYERLSAGHTLALIDSAPPPPDPFAELGHAGTLAFELSAGRERMVVNCGHRSGENWRVACRATAAHSTVVVADANSAEVTPEGLGPRPVVTVRRQEDAGNIWVDADHSGYERRFGLKHRRRTYLSAAGDTFRGEDTLEGTPAEGTTFTVRFHLHPDVQASLLGDGALLRLGNGEGWRFRAGGATIALEESVYLGQIGELRRAEQIVLSGTVPAEGVAVKWAFGRIETAN
jgi:uncharacterized heparinase superfamily protein